MSADTPVCIEPETWERNLAALREVDPDTAARVSAVRLPPAVQPCVARDGTATYRITGADGHAHWFGGTSAPTISAPAFLSRFEPGGGNVFLYGIGSGAEVSLLLDRLEPHRGVLVFERDAVQMSLALRLRNFAGAIRTRRLVVLLSAEHNLESELGRFLAGHEGYACPDRILIWPWLERPQVRELQAILERIAARTASRRQAAIAEIQAAFPKRQPRPLPLRPSLAIVALQSGPWIETWAQEAADAARQLGCVAEIVAPFDPTKCTNLFLAKKLHLCDPELVVALRTSRPMLAGVLAPAVPIVTWIDTPLGPEHAPDRLGPADSVAVTTEAGREAVMATGLADWRAAVVPRWLTPHADTGTESARTHDVAIIHDLVSSDPERAGLKLNTHKVLWSIVASEIAGDPDAFDGLRAEEYLARAESVVGMAIEDPTARVEFIRRIREQLGPSILASAAARGAATAGATVHSWGYGWSESEGVTVRGPVQTTSIIAQHLFRYKLMVSIPAGLDVGPEVFAAIAAKAVVIRRRTPRDSQAGGMAALFAEGREYVGFSGLTELTAVVRDLLSDDARRAAIAEAALERARREHTMAQRMQTILELARAVAQRAGEAKG